VWASPWLPWNNKHAISYISVLRKLVRFMGGFPTDLFPVSLFFVISDHRNICRILEIYLIFVNIGNKISLLSPLHIQKYISCYKSFKFFLDCFHFCCRLCFPTCPPSSSSTSASTVSFRKHTKHFSVSCHIHCFIFDFFENPTFFTENTSYNHSTVGGGEGV
jgi:hypothetical protein